MPQCQEPRHLHHFISLRDPDIAFFYDTFVLVHLRGAGALKELVTEVDEDLPRRGLQFLIEEAEPALIRHALEGGMGELLEEQKTRYRMSIAAVEGLQAGEEPREMKEKLRRLYEGVTLTSG